MKKHIIQSFAIATTLLASTFGAMPAQARDTAQTIQADASLVETVRASLGQSGIGAESNTDIQVSASHGAVNLSGWMRYADDPQRAASVARSIEGVQSVTTNVRTWSSRLRP